MEYNRQWKPGAPCPGNDAVICSDQSKCSRCGWNPEVAAQRLAAVGQGLKQKPPRKRGAIRGNN